MKFNDLYFSKQNYFSVGIEEESGDYFLSIPVSNRMVDYEEYYRIPEELYIKYKSNLDQLSFIAEECRNRQRDKDLFIEPGTDRGNPV